MRADAGNMVSPIAPVSSAGPQSRSSTMILAARAAASLGRASSACWLQSAKPAWAPCSPSRCRDWRATAVTGTRDQRVRDALQLVFSKFAEFQSARQVHIWLRDEGIELPVKSRDGEARGIVWRLPAYNIVHNILTNPIYAGAYAFGRTTSKVSVEHGRKRGRRGVHRPMAEWDVLITDHHGAYITWDEFERNQRVIANNATGKGSATVKGAVRCGELLLPGLLRCGHCGRKLHVSYSGKLGRYDG